MGPEKVDFGLLENVYSSGYLPVLQVQDARFALSFEQELEDSAGGGDAERPPEAGGGSSSMPTAAMDAMDTRS